MHIARNDFVFCVAAAKVPFRAYFAENLGVKCLLETSIKCVASGAVVHVSARQPCTVSDWCLMRAGTDCG